MSNSQTAAQTVMSLCINLLSRYPKTEKEIADKIQVYLAKDEFADLTQEEKTQVQTIVCERLKEADLINDELYTQSFIRANNSSIKPDGSLLVIKKLRHKGVPPDVLNAYSAQLTEHDHTNAHKLLTKKFGTKVAQTDQPTSHKLLHKKSAYLASRGFPYSSYADLLGE